MCDRIRKTYADFQCDYYEDGYVRAIHGSGIGSVEFEPITIQIDDTLYEVPFYTFFEKVTNGFIVLSNYTSPEGHEMVLGMPFLESYYQAYDLVRN